MTRKTFLTMSTGAIVAPFVYAMNPSQGISHTIKMEAPRDLIKDMHAMWLGALDCRCNDLHPNKFWVKFKETSGYYHTGLQVVGEDELPKFLENNRLIVRQDLIEALAIAWMDAAANYDRRMTDEETKEFIMQFESFSDYRGKQMHYDRLVFGTDHFDVNTKFYKGKFKTPMQEQIVTSITFSTMLNWGETI